jgi:hypothetical protein
VKDVKTDVKPVKALPSIKVIIKSYITY